MNREERLLFLLADDKMQNSTNTTSSTDNETSSTDSQTSEPKSADTQFTLDTDTPMLPEQKINEPYQTATVDNDGSWVDVCTINVEPDEAAHITQLANDWYPGMVFQLKADGIAVENDIQRQMAPTNGPQDANIIVADKLVWRAYNDGSEPRDVAAVADGKYVSQSVYDKLLEEHTSEQNNVSNTLG